MDLKWNYPTSYMQQRTCRDVEIRYSTEDCHRILSARCIWNFHYFLRCGLSYDVILKIRKTTLYYSPYTAYLDSYGACIIPPCVNCLYVREPRCPRTLYTK